MKKIYAFVATVLVATSLFFVQKNESKCLLDANIEAIAGIERPVHSPANCIQWFGGVCTVQFISKEAIPIPDMSQMILYNISLRHG